MAPTAIGGSSMEEITEINRKNQSPNIKLQVAIRCAKAAILLSSLKHHSTTNSTTFTTDDDEEVEKLKKELVKEKLKNKKMRTCRFMELLLQIALLFSLWTLCSLIAFNFLY
ncbi:hypothetical protein ACH5RR_034578 [Cinchona calisaya]|uniref:Transmembrane protein n=1 Tax=Cinchona calisaya TaxID=153742 RepID=A0ABD2YFU1_9GENT